MNAFIRPIVTIFSIIIIIWAASALLRLKTTEIYMNAASITQGLAAGQELKIGVMRYYNEYGRLPESNHDAHLKDATHYAKDALDSAGIGEGGVITLIYNAKSGVAGGSIQLIPNSNNHRLDSRWACVTKSFPTINKFFPQCRYQKISGGDSK